MNKFLLGVLTILLLQFPAQAEDLSAGWHGVKWGSTQAQALAVLRQEFPNVTRLDNGSYALTGKIAGYNGMIFLDPGKVTQILAVFDSQAGKTTSQLFSEFAYNLLQKRYGEWFLAYRDLPNGEWETVSREQQYAEEDPDWEAFSNATKDAMGTWRVGGVGVELYTYFYRTNQRALYIRYRHIAQHADNIRATETRRASEL
jgi:hypothetical protein